MKDVIRYLPYINLKRIANFIKLYFSFWVSRILKRAVHFGKPFAVSVEPGTACTLHCPECPTGAGLLKRPKGMMSLEWYEKLLDEMLPELTVLNLYLQGEPLMHPDFTGMVRLASERNIYVITSTNGQVFSEKIAEEIIRSGLSEIYFSLDGITQQTYEKYRRGGDIEKVKNAVRTLSRAKKKAGAKHPRIIVQFIVFRHNEHEVNDLKKLAKELGADKSEIKTAQFNEFSSNDVEPPLNSRYRRYVETEGFKLKGHSYNHCWKSWMSMVFTWEGMALLCCYDKDGEYVLGDIKKAGLNEIWEGEKSNSFRNIILQNKKMLKICTNCPEGRTFFT